MEKREEFKEGDRLKVINNQVINDNNVAPKLDLGAEYTVFKVIKDKKGFQHLDVGLKSQYNYIRSIETGEELENGHLVHWCHPSRFEKIIPEEV